jgi:hypothetical protein
MKTFTTVAVVLAIVAAGETSQAQEKSRRDTIVGTWVLTSIKLNGDKMGGVGAFRPDTRWKFRKDGTCLYINAEAKYKYSHDDKELIITEAHFFGKTQINADVKFMKTKDTEQMILKWVQLGQRYEVAFDLD